MKRRSHQRAFEDNHYMESISNNQLEGLFDSTLQAFVRAGQIDRELLFHSPKAIDLAFALFPNVEIAFQIALDSALNVKRLANVKEHYRRHYKADKKTKVLLSRPQIFQKMILCEFQKWGKYQETHYLLQYLRTCNPEVRTANQTTHCLQESYLEEELKLSELEHNPRLAKLIKLLEGLSFDEREIVVRYLGFLIQDSLNNNPYQVAFVVSHMMYDYTLSRITDICSFLNPDAMSEHYLYTLKPKIMTKVKKRFGYFVSCKGEGVNERFDSQEDLDGQLSQFVKSWLYIFIPWETSCLDDNADMKGGSTEGPLFNRLERIGNKDQKEVGRAHVVICPNCYASLIAEFHINRHLMDEAKQIPPPKLSIPQFKIPKEMGNNQMQKTGIDQQNLEPEEEVKRIKQSLEKNSTCVASVSKYSKELLVFVDGRKEGELDLTKAGSIRLNLDETATLLKVMSRDDDDLLLLATLFLCRGEIEQSLLYRFFRWRKYSTALEGGGKIMFVVSFSEDEMGGRFTVDIDYRRPRIKAMSSLWQQINNFLEPVNTSLALQGKLVKSFIMAAIVIFIFGFLFFQFFIKQPKPDEQLIKNKPLRVNQTPPEQNSIVTEKQNQPGQSQTTTKNNDSTQLIISLKDGNGIVTLDNNGNLAGLESLSPNDRQLVKTALKTQRVKTPLLLEELVGLPQQLMGNDNSTNYFALISPVGTVVQDDRPTLRWHPLIGATGYIVSIYDSNFTKVGSSELLLTTDWKISRPLERGKIYTWQVRAIKYGKEIIMPSPGSPDAKFKVLEQSKVDALERAEQAYGDSHLVMGLFYAQAGLLDDAERELQALLDANPQSQVAKKLLHSFKPQRHKDTKTRRRYSSK